MTALGAVFLASQVALMVHGLTDAVTWSMVRPGPIVWVVWGLAIATWIVVNSSSNVPQKESYVSET